MPVQAQFDKSKASFQIVREKGGSVQVKFMNDGQCQVLAQYIPGVDLDPLRWLVSSAAAFHGVPVEDQTL